MKITYKVKRRLGKLGLGQLAIGIIQAEPGKGVSQFLLGHLYAVGKTIEKFCAHADGLGTLPWIKKSQTHEKLKS